MKHRDAVLGLCAVLILPSLIPAQQQQGHVRSAPAAMSASAMKATARRWLIEIWDNGNTALLDSLADPSYTYRANARRAVGREALKPMIAAVRKIPGHRNVIETQIAEGTTVLTRGVTYGTNGVTGERTALPWVMLTQFARDKVASDWEFFEPAPTGFDGVYQYLPPLKGLAVYRGSYFNFLFGPVDGSATMTAVAGTYRMVGDTAVATILSSTDLASPPGSRFRILSAKTLPGDTNTYTVIDSTGRPTAGGRTLRIQ